jgi:hypothetical protein
LNVRSCGLPTTIGSGISRLAEPGDDADGAGSGAGADETDGVGPPATMIAISAARMTMCKPPMSGATEGARTLVRPPTPEEKVQER